MEVKATSSSGPIFSSNWRHCGLISNRTRTQKLHIHHQMVRILDESKNTNIFPDFYFAYQLSSNSRINCSLLCAICNFLTFKDGFEYNQWSKSPKALLLKLCIWLRLYYRDTLAYSSLHKPTISSNKISISQPLCQTFNI